MPCGAKTRSGEPCGQPAMANGRCRMHGGKSLAGTASRTFKHGRRSRYLPVSLSDDYRKQLDDPILSELGDELALIDARINDLLLGLGDGESRQAWKLIGASLRDYQEAVGLGADPAVAGKSLAGRIAEIHSGAMLDLGTWDEIYGLIDQRRRCADVENKRLIAAHQAMTAEQAGVLGSLLLGVIRKHVTDANTLAAIGTEIIELVPVRDRPGIALGRAAIGAAVR